MSDNQRNIEPVSKGFFDRWLYPAEQRVCDGLGTFVREHWYCLAGGVILGYELSRWQITQEYVFEGTLTGMIALVFANHLRRSQRAAEPARQPLASAYPLEADPANLPSEPQESRFRAGTQTWVAPPPLYRPPVVITPSQEAVAEAQRIRELPLQQPQGSRELTCGGELHNLHARLVGIRENLTRYSRLQGDADFENGELIAKCRRALTQASERKVAELAALKEKAATQQLSDEDQCALARLIDIVNKAQATALAAERLFQSGVALSHSYAVRDTLHELLKTGRPDDRVVSVRSDGSCGWAAAQLFLELLSGERDLATLPTVGKVVVDSSNLQNKICERSRQLALSGELIAPPGVKQQLHKQLQALCALPNDQRPPWLQRAVGGKTVEEINAWALSEEGIRLFTQDSRQRLRDQLRLLLDLPADQRPEWLQRAIEAKTAEEIEGFARSENGLDLLAANEPSLYVGSPLQTWKEHIQTQLGEFIKDARQNMLGNGIPELVRGQVEICAVDPTREKDFIFSEEENRGWKAYVACEAMPGFWATFLELYLFSREFNIDVQLVSYRGNELVERSAYEEYIGFVGAEEPRAQMHLVLGADHYDLLLTPENLSQIQQARANYLLTHPIPPPSTVPASDVGEVVAASPGESQPVAEPPSTLPAAPSETNPLAASSVSCPS
jgi:hypothetical protein